MSGREYIALSVNEKDDSSSQTQRRSAPAAPAASGHRSSVPLKLTSTFLVRLAALLLLVLALCALLVYVEPSWPSSLPVLGGLGGRRKLLTGRKEILDSLYGINATRKTWLEHWESLNDEHLAPATKQTQRWIHEYQNPPLKECAQKKFLLFSNAGTRDEGHGLGSLIHITGYMMMRAMDEDRILAWHDNALGDMFFEDDCESDEGLKSLECMTEKLTHCPRSSMREDNSVEYGVFSGFPTGSPQSIPAEASRLLDAASHIEWTVDAKKYWWRAQSAAYVLRMNPQSLAYLAKARLDPTGRQSFSLHGDQNRVIEGSVPYPLPAGTASIHIRHGDKSIEMKLVDFKDYLAGAEQLASLNPLYYSRTAYLSSEDPAVFEEAHRTRYLDPDTLTTPNVEWTFYAANIKRANGGPAMQLDTVKNRTEMTLSWMSELFMALECDSWVGTRGSNWNRLIDELRCVFVNKCSHPYVEVNEKSSWNQYSWR